MKTLILCAGLGTRLKPLTDTTPKALLEIQGKPLIHYLLNHLSQLGLKEVAINLHHHAKLIKNFIQDGSAWNLNIHYLEEENLLGGVGTIQALKSWLLEDKSCNEFLVIYGDLLCNENFLDMQKFHQQKNSLATLLVYEGKDNSIVKLDEHNKIDFFYERPSKEFAQSIYKDFPLLHVNGGIQILSHQIFDFLPNTVPADLPRDVYAKIAGQQAVYGYPLKNYRLNIDSYEALQLAQKMLL